MPDNSKNQSPSRSILKLQDRIQRNMDDLYSTTYFSSPQAGKDLNSLGQQINKELDRITGHNMDTFGIPSVSKLYTRLGLSSDGTKSIEKDIGAMFEEPLAMDDLYGTFMSNRYLKELDIEIDTVCTYMTDLEEALQVKKDNVLSADHFTKDFLIIRSPQVVDTDSVATFEDRCFQLKQKYDVLKLIDKVYDKTARYGEQFIYIVPTATAVSRLLTNKPNTNPGMGFVSYTEASEIAIDKAIQENTSKYTISMDNNGMIIKENGDIVYRADGKVLNEAATQKALKSKDKFSPVYTSLLSDNEKFHINLEICESGIIESAVQEQYKAYGKKAKNASLAESYYGSLSEAGDEKKARKTSGNLSFEGMGDNVVNNGIVADGLIKDNENVKVKIPGAIVKCLNREQVIPIYIDDICLGYYYLEVKSLAPIDNFIGMTSSFSNPMDVVNRNANDITVSDTTKQDDTIRYIAGQLSTFIDKKFVNNNQDLSKEIYMILKYNDLFNTPGMDSLKITFVPPEDMIHSYFALDDVTHRGISDLAKSLVPAKIYSSLYITNSIATLTRGQDKRVYYVKQTVDTNISRTLLTTLNQIKQGNFGIRQYQSINNILGITGRFNDYLIPTNASGDPPIQFEVMPGQQIDVHTDLLDILKDMAVSATGVPLDIIQSRNSIDYAMQLSMSSSKFLRTVYTRQGEFQPIVEQIITKIYNYEYSDSIQLDVTLPPPNFLNIANTNQVFDNIKNLVQSSVEMELSEDSDQAIRTEFTKLLTRHYVGTYIDTTVHADLLAKAKLNVAKNKDQNAEE